MKKLFTISAFLVLFINQNVLHAQNCDFAQAGVQFNYSYISPISGNCVINIDLYFDLRTNEGSKYVILHIWPTAQYPNLAYDKAPDSAQLAGAVTVITHHFQNHADSHIDSIYKPDTRVSPQYMNMNLDIGPSDINAGYNRFTITNLNLEVPGSCGIPKSFIVDMWSTESESMNSVQCMDKGTVFYANNPQIAGLFSCSFPRSYNIQIFSIDPVEIDIQYDVYIDNGDNVFNKIEDTLNIKSEAGITLSSGSPFNSGMLSYLPYSNEFPYAKMTLWVELISNTLPNSIIFAIENTCAALPVKIEWFAANRTGNNVNLRWITASETDNKGFYIERKSGYGEWKEIGFVASLTTNGNSVIRQEYSFLDQQPSKDVIQYRLKQMDKNRKCSYSDIRVVRFYGKNEAAIFPNPSPGSFYIVFPDPQKYYGVKVYTSEGKIIYDMNDCKSVLNITGLRPGIYIVKIVNNQDREFLVNKVIIQ